MKVKKFTRILIHGDDYEEYTEALEALEQHYPSPQYMWKVFFVKRIEPRDTIQIRLRDCYLRHVYEFVRPTETIRSLAGATRKVGGGTLWQYLGELLIHTLELDAGRWNPTDRFERDFDKYPPQER